MLRDFDGGSPPVAWQEDVTPILRYRLDATGANRVVPLSADMVAREHAARWAQIDELERSRRFFNHRGQCQCVICTVQRMEEEGL